MFDAYMGFFIGAAFLYSVNAMVHLVPSSKPRLIFLQKKATYRCLQTFIEIESRNAYENHPVIRSLAVLIFLVSVFAFYTLAAM